jgi:hypothetical protein
VFILRPRFYSVFCVFLPPGYRSTFILRPGCNNSFAFAFVLDVAMLSVAACFLCGLDVAVGRLLQWLCSWSGSSSVLCQLVSPL